MGEEREVVCKVCGERFRPEKGQRYTGVKMNSLIAEPISYDCYDCPHCGSQAIVKERMKQREDEEEGEKRDMKWTHVAAWIGTAAAVGVGIWVTGSAWCLWAMILPAITQWAGGTDKN